ncbi:MAG: glycosyl transferase, partial [Acidimicrobiales bacterium]
VTLRQRRRTIWPLLSTVIVVTVVSALFYGLLRFRAPAEVALVVLAAVALAALQERRSLTA